MERLTSKVCKQKRRLLKLFKTFTSQKNLKYPFVRGTEPWIRNLAKTRNFSTAAGQCYLISPCWGISMQWSTRFNSSTGTPSRSFPSRMAHLSGKAKLLRGTLLLACSIATIVHPCSLSLVMYSGSCSSPTPSTGSHFSAVTETPVKSFSCN